MPLSTSFKSVSYPVVGGSYQSRSKPLSQQRTLNLYPEIAQDGRTETVLQKWLGLKAWVSGTAGEIDRGLYKKTFDSKAYQVAGTTLYSIDSAGTRTSIGTIAGGDQVTFADNGSLLVIVGGNTAYSYDGTTLSTLSYSFTPRSVGYLNNQFIFQGSDNFVYISTAGETSVSVGNNFAFDSSSDGLVRSYVYDQFLFGFGSDTIEPWENTAEGIPPFDRMAGVIAEKTGLAGIQAVNNTSKAMYFLGADGEAYQMVNFQANKITPPAIANEFQGYGDNQNCKVQTVSFENQDFVLFIFPSQNKVWVFSEQIQLWFELDHDTDAKRYLGNSFARMFNKNLVVDYTNGAIYELDLDTYQNNGTTMICERIMRPLSGEQFGNPRQKLQLGRLDFSVETGTGNPNDVDPEIMVSTSYNGVTFADEVWLKLGRENEYVQDVSLSSNKYFTDLAVKLRYSGNTQFALYTARALVREGGR